MIVDINTMLLTTKEKTDFMAGMGYEYRFLSSCWYRPEDGVYRTMEGYNHYPIFRIGATVSVFTTMGERRK